MIEKSRLEELIKQGATIYNVDYNSNSVEPINLLFTTIDGNTRHIKGEEDGTIFETKKQAEWALKYYATRTEELNLPTWEELIDKKKNRRFYINEFVCRNEYDLLVVCSLGVDFEGTIEIRNASLNHKLLFQAPLSEENYEKACDLCVKLFKGESDETNN